MDERANPWNELPPAPPTSPAEGDVAGDDGDDGPDPDDTAEMPQASQAPNDDTVILAAPPLLEDPPIIEPQAWPPPPPEPELQTARPVQLPAEGWPTAPTQPPPGPAADRIDPASRARRDATSSGRRTPGWLAAVVGGVAGAAVTLGVLAATGNLSDDPEPVAAVESPPGTVVERVIERSTVLQADESTDRVSLVAASAVPSIVTVQIFDIVDQPNSQAGSGSGVVFRDDGFVLTNNHVIAGANQIKVSLANGDTYEADLIGTDPRTDIAVLSIDETGLPVTPFADVDTIEIGDLAVAVGNPLGLEGGPSVTAGVVSAFDRQLLVNPVANETLWGLLQTDAPITRGSSGGALLNDQAELIGITTAIGLSDVGAEGLGFAVPVDLVESIATDLIAEGEIRHAFLGITGLAAFETTPDGVEVPIGAEITSLVPGSAIGAAGAQEGDVITALGSREVTSMNLLVAELLKFRAGQEVTVSLERDGQSLEIPLVLDVRTDN